MTKRGEHTPISEEEAEDFARRMAEAGATEAELLDPGAWFDFLDEIIEQSRGYKLTGLQAGMGERGRYLYEAGLKQAGLRLTAGGRLSRYKAGVAGWEVYATRYRDITTGRFVSAADAYSRRFALGLSTPRPIQGVWKYPSWWIPR